MTFSYSLQSKVSICLLTCMLGAFCPGVVSASEGADGAYTIILLVGGTGDLASKYLWQSIFNVFHHQRNELFDPENRDILVNRTFDFLAAGRSEQDKGNVVLNRILRESVKCESADSEWSGKRCHERKAEFVDSVAYIQLQTPEDFSILCTELLAKFSHVSAGTRKELIMYLSVNPSAYETFLQNFNSMCYAQNKEKFQLKLALEKPFGVDKQTAESMSEKLLAHFEEKQLYRVDHFLGKPVVKAILPFRLANPEIDQLMNKDHVERVEIFVKETVDVQGRGEMYRKLGVLRDLHQNHLTEMLTLTAMDLPTDLHRQDQLLELKERILQQMESVRRHNSLFGQYSSFLEHVNTPDTNDSSARNVPTFAAVTVKINSPRWRGVPFVLLSGKQLDARESFVRIVFKNNFVCVSHCGNGKLEEGNQGVRQVIFHIGHGKLKTPSILVSKSFKEPVWPENFKESIDPTVFSSSLVYGENFKRFYVGCVMRDTPAYESVFLSLLFGKHKDFVGTRHLLLSWHLWDYIVSVDKQIRIYQSGDKNRRLNFILKDNHLEFIPPNDEEEGKGREDAVITHTEVTHDYIQTPSTFLGHRLITSHTDHLAYLLAREIDRAAEVEIQSKGSFHIAFSGGTSVVKVFQMLAQSFANLHWQAVHAWQVDERCVPHQDERSNFQTLDRELLRFVDIPYQNIHPMPVETSGRLCDEEIGAAHAYAESIRNTVTNAQFDFILLGVGEDGHTASLFPESLALHVDSETYVLTTADGPVGTHQRMTLTLPLINKAKRVAVFVKGKNKRHVVNELESVTSVDKFPILGVNPVNGTLTWFIDYDAYTGF